MFVITPENAPKALACLYNNSQPLGMGWLHYDPTPMTEDQAAEILEDVGFPGRPAYFDYYKGRCMKVSIGLGPLDLHLFTRDNPDPSEALLAAGVN